MEKTVGQEQVWKRKSKEFTFGHDSFARSLRHHVGMLTTQPETNLKLAGAVSIWRKRPGSQEGQTVGPGLSGRLRMHLVQCPGIC